MNWFFSLFLGMFGLNYGWFSLVEIVIIFFVGVYIIWMNVEWLGIDEFVSEFVYCIGLSNRIRRKSECGIEDM